MDDREARKDSIKGPDVAIRSMLDSQPLVAESGYPGNSIPLWRAASTCWQDYFCCPATSPFTKQWAHGTDRCRPLSTGEQKIVFDLESQTGRSVFRKPLEISRKGNQNHADLDRHFVPFLMRKNNRFQM